jgi:hypothetical protein
LSVTDGRTQSYRQTATPRHRSVDPLLDAPKPDEQMWLVPDERFLDPEVLASVVGRHADLELAPE